MAQIMISYSRTDSIIAADIERDLQNAGYRVWRDVSSIIGGTEWVKAIEKSINEASIILALISKQSLESRWVDRELTYADIRSKPIVPLVLEKVDLPLVLVRNHSIDFTANYGGAIAQLLAQLPNLLQVTKPALLTNTPILNGLSLRNYRRRVYRLRNAT